jgi:ABC-type Mn2+/Zn2+ transport system ATPase subunit
MLKVEKLVVDYGEGSDGPALKGVDLNIENEKAVIVGPNGSGKSTLLKAVLGLVPIKSGKIFVFGNDVRKVSNDLRINANLAEIYRLVNLPADNIIELFCEMKDTGSDKIRSMISEFELDSILKKRTYKMSSGQKKMFCNILALGLSHELCMLDEPFENVDEARKRRLLDLLSRHEGETILITHEFNLLERLSNWSLYFMFEGMLWGKFLTSQLPRLYLNKGEVQDAVKVIETSIGKLSITLDKGQVAITSVSNANSLLERV